MITDPGIVEFRSSAHPAFRSRANIFSARMAVPMGVCMLPVMILGLAAVLQGQSVLAHLYIGFPAALSVAAAWTFVRVRDVIVELHFRESDVGIRSLVSAASPTRPVKWFRLLDVKSESDGIRLTLGHEFFSIDLSQWPEQNNLRRHLLLAAGHDSADSDD
jgi:hypothetical protein